jgi:hypothetical protein
MSEVIVTPVSDKKSLRDFLDVSFALYRNDPYWVAPLYLERFDHLNPKKNPYFQHADAQLFVARRNGKPVGRISAQHDHLRLAHHKDATGQFGFFECENDSETARQLLNAAEVWLKQRKLSGMQGPFNFSINDEVGLLVDGFDHRPNMMMGHALPFYDGLLAAQGLRKAKDVIAYHIDNTTPFPPLLQRVAKRAMASGEIAIRPLDKKHIKRDITIIMDIFNDAWSHNWGFVPFTQAELDKLAGDLKMLVHGDYVAIAHLQGRVLPPWQSHCPTSMTGSPDSTAGCLPFNWAEAGEVRNHQAPSLHPHAASGCAQEVPGRSGRLCARGVRDRQGPHLSRQPRRQPLRRCPGCSKTTRASATSSRNWGRKPYKTYRIYEKAL